MVFLVKWPNQKHSKPHLKKYLLPALIFFGMIIPTLFLNAQDKQLRGNVYDKASREPLKDVKIVEEKNQNLTYTDSTGYFSISLPRKRRSTFQFTHPEYLVFTHRQPRNLPNKKLKILMEHLNHKERDTIWRTNKNTLSLSLLEFITGAVAIRYERFLLPVHSVGLHTSVYLYGGNHSLFFGTYKAEYKGVKFAPFYRFYPAKSNSTGFFVEAKLPFGYFNFTSLPYTYHSGEDAKNFPQDFWTVGAGFSLGMSFKLTKGSYGIGNFSLGLQLFPMNVPSEITEEYDTHSQTYTAYNTWWYLTGPGAVVEMKFTMGGLW